MAIWKYTRKLPEYQVAKYIDASSMDDLKMLAGTDAYTIEATGMHSPVVHIAGLTLRRGELLVKDPSGLLSVMNGSDFWPYYNEVKE